MIRNSLSISNSSLLKQIKRIVSLVLIIVVLFAAISVMNEIYFEEELWNHILWNSFYNQENIDNVFIGSSHVFCGVNPFVLDEINCMNNFDLSAPGLTLSASYYLLRETDRVYDLENAYVELYYDINTGPNSADSEWTLKNNWRTFSYLKPSLNKWEYVSSTVDSSRYIETLIPFVRYRSRLFDGEYINSVRDNKNTEEWKNCEYIEESDTGVVEYMQKGFFRSDHTIESVDAYLYRTERNLETEGLLTEDNCEYIQKIIDYCKSENINIKFFITPIYETQIHSSRDYDAYHQQVSDIINSNNVELYDFNLCKAEYLDIMHQQYFFDNGHLNETGADLFTPFLWGVLENTYEKNKIYFCNSYIEKISLDDPELYGIYYEDSDEGKACTFASNTDTELEYSIEFIPEDGDSIIIQDFSTNKEFVIPSEIGGGVLHVEARLLNTKTVVSEFDINY